MRSLRRESGLTLVETLIAITIFSIMTVGLVPVIGTAMSGGASTRTESVGRNVTSKTLERLRGLQYHVAYSTSTDEVDVLDLYFPGRTPAYVAGSVPTGYDAATQSYVTTCHSGSSADACKTLPGRTEIPSGYVVEVRATFKTPANPAVTQPVPVGYAWNAAAGQDAPPSELLEVKVTSAWSVGTKARTFALQTYLGAHARAALASGGGGAATPTPPGGGAPTPPPPPTTVKLRGEARIDYGYEVTTTYQDNSVPAKVQEFTGTLGTAVAYGEQLESGSKAELSVRAGQMRLSRAADPAVSGDAGVDANFTGASIDAVAPPDAGTVTTTTAPQQNAVHVETPITGGAGFLAPSEAGTLSGTRGASPTVSGGLPFVRGYYDLNGTTGVSPASVPTHMWLMPQVSGQVTGTETTTNPLAHWTSSFSKKTITVNDSGTGGVDPRGEVSVDSTATTPAASRAVTATATIPAHGMALVFPNMISPSNAAVLEFTQFSANVACTARADASAASTATGSWSATLEYYSYEGSGRNAAYELHRTTLPTQTLSGEPIAVGNTNPLATIKAMNSGNGPKIHNASSAAYDVYLFTGNGRRGLLTGWSQGKVETSITSDDRIVSAQLNGAIRMESSPLWGPWPNASTGQVSQKPLSDFTFNIGKLSCKAEDYR